MAFIKFVNSKIFCCELVTLVQHSNMYFFNLFIKSEVAGLYKEIDGNQSEYLKKLNDNNKQLSDLVELKNKLNSEKLDLQRRNEHLEHEFQQLNNNSKKLHQDLDNSNLQLENEILVNMTANRVDRQKQ
jgi:hypothetical protein